MHQDPVRAERLIEDLSALLRASLDASHQSTIRLSDELRLVENYLSIERARFGDRVRPTIDVPAAMLEAAVPAFSLQPLVENAVKHGVARSPDGIHIGVSASRAGDTLTVAVEDDGPGFPRRRCRRGTVWRRSPPGWTHSTARERRCASRARRDGRVSR